MRPGSSLERWITVISWCALVAFVIVSLGPMLIGQAGFLDTKMFATFFPWNSSAHDPSPLAVPLFGDTVDTVSPQIMAIVDAARAGTFGEWNPYVAGGAELGGLPNPGAFSPLALPWWVLPFAVAPVFVKLLEITAITVGMSLFLRRLGVRRFAWPIGSIVFASSGFMVAWSNWPHTRVAALIPLLFWAVDRVAVRRKWIDAIPVAVVVMSMLLGGFPAVTGYALYAAAAWLLYRAITTHRRLIPVLLCAVEAGVGVIGGVLLSAWQLVPFAINATSVLDFGVRVQDADSHLPLSALASALVPNISGGPEPVGLWAEGHRVEAFSYIGAAAVVLALAAMLLRPRMRSRITGRAFFLWALVIVVVLTYMGGVVLALTQNLPIFSNNYVGRLRVLVGFFAALLASIGLSALADPVPLRVEFRLMRLRPVAAWRVGLWVLAGAIGLALSRIVISEYRAAPPDRLPDLRVETGVALAIALVTLILVVAGWILPGRVMRVLVGVAVPALVVVPALAVTTLWWQPSPLSTFYASSPTHAFLAKRLGSDRYATVGQAMMPGTNTYYELRSVGGHAFHTTQWKDLLRSVDAPGFLSPTYSTLLPNTLNETIHSPILDRLGVTYVVAAPTDPVVGAASPLPDATGSAELSDGSGVDSPVHTGAVRGIIFRAPTPVVNADGATLRVQIVEADSGDVLAETETWTTTLGGERSVAVAGDDIPPGTPWKARLSVDGDADVAVDANGDLVLGTVVPVAGDGIEVVHTGDTTVYRRTTAVGRAHWGDSSVAIENGADRIAALGGDEIPLTTVVLDHEADTVATDAGSTATIVEKDQSTDRMSFDVRSTGRGWLVVEDSFRRPGWSATVDGEPVALVAADHAAAAVALDGGHHTVVLTYRTPGLAVGVVVSLVSALAAIAALVWFAVASRRRRRTE